MKNLRFIVFLVLAILIVASIAIAMPQNIHAQGCTNPLTGGSVPCPSGGGSGGGHNGGKKRPTAIPPTPVPPTPVPTEPPATNVAPALVPPGTGGNASGPAVVPPIATPVTPPPPPNPFLLPAVLVGFILLLLIGGFIWFTNRSAHKPWVDPQSQGLGDGSVDNALPDLDTGAQFPKMDPGNQFDKSSNQFYKESPNNDGSDKMGTQPHMNDGSNQFDKSSNQFLKLDGMDESPKEGF